MEWKVGDWATFELRVVQITADRGGYLDVSDGYLTIGVSDVSRQALRPLTLRGKVAVEMFKSLYDQLYKIDGHGGFNFPEISRHFAQLALGAIDNPENSAFYKAAENFVDEAECYRPVIDGVKLFRKAAG